MNKKETYFKQLQKKMQIALLSLFAIAFSFTSCDFFADGVAEDNSNSLLLQYLLEQMNKQNVEITSLKLSGSNVSVQVGGIAYLGKPLSVGKIHFSLLTASPLAHGCANGRRTKQGYPP